MHKCDPEEAAKMAISLLGENIKGAGTWIPPEIVVEFVEVVYNYLLSGEINKESDS